MVWKAIWMMVALVVLTEPAGAGTLTTPAMFSGTLTTLMTCEAVNVGNKPIGSVTVRLVPFGVGAAPEQTCTPLAPGAVCTANQSTFFFSGHCRVEFTGGKKKNIRGSMAVIDSGNNVRAQLAAQ